MRQPLACLAALFAAEPLAAVPNDKTASVPVIDAAGCAQLGDVKVGELPWGSGIR